jgi:hypothetical protein
MQNIELTYTLNLLKFHPLQTLLNSQIQGLPHWARDADGCDEKTNSTPFQGESLARERKC